MQSAGACCSPTTASHFFYTRGMLQPQLWRLVIILPRACCSAPGHPRWGPRGPAAASASAAVRLMMELKVQHLHEQRLQDAPSSARPTRTQEEGCRHRCPGSQHQPQQLPDSSQPPAVWQQRQPLGTCHLRESESAVKSQGPSPCQTTMLCRC